MEEAENGKESSHSAHSNRMNDSSDDTLESLLNVCGLSVFLCTPCFIFGMCVQSGSAALKS